MTASPGLPSTKISGPPLPPGFLETPPDFNPLDDPERANEIVAQIQAPGPGEPPKIKPPDDDVVVMLPGGLINPDGTVYRKVEVRELTGADEEALARGQATKNIGHFVSTLIERGVVSIEGRPPQREALNSLLMGDRTHLIMHIRRLTYGDTIHLELKCPACQNEFEVLYSLTDDVPIQNLEDPKDRVFRVQLRDGGYAVLALATGADQEAVLDQQGLSTAEANTFLLGRCLREVNGQNFLTPSHAMEAARAMGLKDRQTLLNELVARQPGPRFEEVKQACPRCDREFPLVLDLLDLFRSD